MLINHRMEERLKDSNTITVTCLLIQNLSLVISLALLELKMIFAAEDWPRNIQKFSQNN